MQPPRNYPYKLNHKGASHHVFGPFNECQVGSQCRWLPRLLICVPDQALRILQLRQPVLLGPAKLCIHCWVPGLIGALRREPHLRTGNMAKQCEINMEESRAMRPAFSISPCGGAGKRCLNSPLARDTACTEAKSQECRLDSFSLVGSRLPFLRVGAASIGYKSGLNGLRPQTTLLALPVWPQLQRVPARASQARLARVWSMCVRRLRKGILRFLSHSGMKIAWGWLTNPSRTQSTPEAHKISEGARFGLVRQRQTYHTRPVPSAAFPKNRARLKAPAIDSESVYLKGWRAFQAIRPV